MIALFRKPPRIHGISIPRRRFTARAGLYFLVLFCLPLLGTAAVLDYFLFF